MGGAVRNNQMRFGVSVANSAETPERAEGIRGTGSGGAPGAAAPAQAQVQARAQVQAQVQAQVAAPAQKGTNRVKRGMADMLKGGVIMDVVTPAQAKIAEDAGAGAVISLERVPAGIKSQSGTAPMTDPG